MAAHIITQHLKNFDDPKVCMFQNSLRTVLEFLFCQKHTVHSKSQLASTPTCSGTLSHAKPNDRERQNGNLLAGEHLQVVDIIISR